MLKGLFTYLTAAMLTVMPVQAQEQSWGVTGMMITPPEQGHALQVFAVITESPADLAGIAPGDEIVEVDGVATDSMNFVEVMEATHGKNKLVQAGSEMTMVVSHEGELKTVTVKRVDIQEMAEPLYMLFELIGGDSEALLLLVI